MYMHETQFGVTLYGMELKIHDTCSHKSNQGFQDFLLGGELLCIAMSRGACPP